MMSETIAQEIVSLIPALILIGGIFYSVYRNSKNGRIFQKLYDQNSMFQKEYLMFLKELHDRAYPALKKNDPVFNEILDRLQKIESMMDSNKGFSHLEPRVKRKYTRKVALIVDQTKKPSQ